ncbi:MAG: preprotein translocase subunit SecA [Clostridia bacterium]|nr:preprotein translocase subunit SecA [Clostridia bacterium]
MVLYKEHMSQRGHAFAIVDEVDSILIDEARTPLIISGQGEESTDMYNRANDLVKGMREFRIKEFDEKTSTDTVDADYIVDEKAKSTLLTASGIEKAERFFGIENFSDPENAELAHYVNQAIRARGIMKRDVDYVIKDDQVIIVDTFTGRLMFGRRYSDGLHQAIEAKEHVKIQKENKTLASITFQNYFRLYNKLSGMTGTAQTEELEFREIYNLDVVAVPTNKPMIRVDHPDVIYKTVRAKYDAIIEQIKICNEKGQPVLVGTVSVDKSEDLSKRLKREGIPHTVLNAKHHEKEAEIVAEAGKVGKVTISTNMAGRGTDIMLGGNPEFMAKQQMLKMGYEEDVVGLAMGSSLSVSDEVIEARKVFKDLFEKYKAEIAPLAQQVREAGGLFIIGTERHDSRRIDNQLRGRSGRQGDPGESRFYISFEDDLARLFGGERMYNLVDRLGLEESQPIEVKIVSDTIETAQKRIEDQNFNRRKNVLTYDDVMNQQREIIYKQRGEVLDGLDLKSKIRNMVSTIIETNVDYHTSSPDKSEWNFDELRNYFYGILCSDEDFRYSEEEIEKLTPEEIKEFLEIRADALLEAKEKILGEDRMREFERVKLLSSVDARWMEHIDAMDDLKGSVGLHAYAQRDPLKEYQIIGADMFDEMISGICEDTARGVLSFVPKKQEDIKRKSVAKITNTGFVGGGDGTEKKQPVKKGIKVGRNDPCPCGSGKKYKKCCGINDTAE